MAKEPLVKLAAEARDCTNCELYAEATQTVFGEGPSDARVMLVGEQPGDVEDREGHPFVGPAGALLDKALGDAGVDRSGVYVTNAVKHFRFTRGSGPRRIHAKPDVRHITACHPWLEGELAAVSPAVVVALGATAVRALLGNEFKVTRDRGQLLEWPGHDALALITTHPSAILRTPGETRATAYESLVSDLRLVAEVVSAEGR
jgi:uracil-DNA glycosylase family protein